MKINTVFGYKETHKLPLLYIDGKDVLQGILYLLYFTVSNSNFLQFKQRYTDIYGMLEIKTIHMNSKFLGFIRFSLELGK